MIELITVVFVLILLTVFVIGGLVVKILINRFKKENPCPSNYDWIQREQTKYWNKK